MATTAGGHRKTSDWYWYQGQRDSALCTHDSFTTQQVPHLYWCGICVSSSTPDSTAIVGIGDRTCRDENGSRDSVRRDFSEGIPQRCIQEGRTLDPLNPIQVRYRAALANPLGWGSFKDSFGRALDFSASCSAHFSAYLDNHSPRWMK